MQAHSIQSEIVFYFSFVFRWKMIGSKYCTGKNYKINENLLTKRIKCKILNANYTTHHWYVGIKWFEIFFGLVLFLSALQMDTALFISAARLERSCLRREPLRKDRFFYAFLIIICKWFDVVFPVMVVSW